MSNSSSKDEDLVIVVSLLKLGLHSDLEHLRAAVCDDIRSLSAFSDGILIFYGKCGNALADLEHDLTDLSCPLYFLIDEHGERIDDCIAVALGGNESYGRILAEHQDVALFMTPMWASNWNVMGPENAASGSRMDLGKILKGSGMRKVARIDTGLCFEPGFEEKVDCFAREFGLQRIDLSGGTKFAEGCYAVSKSRLLAERAGRELPRQKDPAASVSRWCLEKMAASVSRWCLETMLPFCQMTWKRLLGE
ncbi:MAG: DUF1638 domain-containing protein [Methanothrix sp.]|nr:DUF1638 domain-containing protein [Methanothrix sp.]